MANYTKVTLFRGQDSVSASGATIGGFVNVANLMHEVVQKMWNNGFKVVFASTDDADLNTASWGTINPVTGVWAPPTVPPKVGAPIKGISVADGPIASIILEAEEKVNSLNPAIAKSAGGGKTHPKEPWRVKFELLNSECVAAYVATPLQLPGYYVDKTVTPNAIKAENWGFVGSHSRLVDSIGTPVDASGAIGAQQKIVNNPGGVGTLHLATSKLPPGVSTTTTAAPSPATFYARGAKQVVKAVMNPKKAGTGYAVGDYLIEDDYFGQTTYTGPTPSPVTHGFYITTFGGGATGGPPGSYGSGVPASPLPNRYRAIFRVQSVDATGGILSLTIVDPGKYRYDTKDSGYPSKLKNYTSTISGIYSTSGTPKSGTTQVEATLTLGNFCSGLDETDTYQGLYNRGNIVGANGASYPLTYELAISNSGFFLGIYESSWSTQIGGSNSITNSKNKFTPGRFNWMVVQRPVDRNFGTILDDVDSSTSKHPVFCVNGVGGLYYSFVVREKDIAHPSAGPTTHTAIAYYDANGKTIGTKNTRYTAPVYTDYPYRVPAVLNSEDSHLLFNPENQISLTEDKKYLVSFPHNLATPRFRYTEELDLIGLTSSDVLMAGQVITINTYGESSAREYLALPPSGQYNTGLRICVAKTTKYGGI